MKKIKKFSALALFTVFVISIFGVVNTLAASPIFKLTSATISEKSDTVDAEILNYDDDDVNINTTFHKVDDYIVYKLVIKNTSSKNYKIKNISTDNSNPYLELSHNSLDNVVVKAKKSVTLELKAVYKNEVTDLEKRTNNDAFKVSFDFTDQYGRIVGYDINGNPYTSDGIFKYVIIAIMSLSGIIVLSIRNKKAKKAIVLVMVFIPFTVYAYTSKVIFKLNTKTALMDKLAVTEVVDGETKLVVIPYNTIPEKPEDPLKDGYTFDGWFIGDEEYNYDRPLEEDEVIEAKYTPIVYNITYILNNGKVTNPKETYTIEDEDFELVMPTRKGYHFAGWVDVTPQEGEGQQVDPTALINYTIPTGTFGDKVFEATYTTRDDTEYVVYHEYETLEDTFEEEIQELNGITESIVYPQIRHRDGFKDPAVQSLKISPEGDSEITYTYMREKYTLSYPDTTYIDLEESTAPNQYRYMTPIKVVAKEKDGHTFSKWSDDTTDQTYTFDMVENKSLTPIYTVNTYTVTFDANNDTTNTTISRDYDTAVGPLPTPIKDDYVLDGWYTSNNFDEKISASTLVKDNVTYYAKWLKTVNFLVIVNDDLLIDNHDDTQQVELLNTEEVEEEYTFSSEDESILTVDSEGKITTHSPGTTRIIITGTKSGLYRKIDVEILPKQYLISFIVNGNSHPQASEMIYEEGSDNRILPVIDDTGYIFDGWYIDEGCQTKLTDEMDLISNPNDDEVTFYGKLYKSVYFMEFEHEDLAIDNHDTKQIEITNPDDIEEEYTYSSSDENIITVSSTGLITTVAPGEASVIITGTTSGLTKEIGVEVIPQQYYISFKVDDNDDPRATEAIYDEVYGMPNLPDIEEENYIFDGWYTTNSYNVKVTDQTVVVGDTTFYGRLLKSVYFLEIDNDDLTIENHESDSIVLINLAELGEGVTYAIDDDSIATVDSNGLVSAVNIGTTQVIITGDISGITKVVNITIVPKKYTVSFDTHGGETVNSIEVEEGNTIDTLPTTRKEGNAFDGWFTSETGGVQLTTSTEINGDITYHAQWHELDQILCHKAITLHTEQCTRTSGGCKGDSLTEVTFGNILGSDTYKVGDAFDCDVNGNEQIDLDENGNSTERFYYLKTINDDTAVLIYYSNLYQGAPNNTQSLAYDEANSTLNVPTTLISNLPTKYVWNNVSLKTTEVQVYNENGGIKSSSVNLPIINYSDYSSRMATYDDIKNPCNISGTSYPITISMQKDTGCPFLFENTGYMGNLKGYWLGTAVESSSGKTFRITGSKHQIGYTDASSATGSGIRPVIEVPLTRMEEPSESTKYIVTFNSNGGTTVSSKEVDKNTSLGTLPAEPTKTNYIFRGWFTDTNYTEQVTAETIINDNITVYAKWIEAGSVCEYNNKGYTTINTAISKVTTSDKATILVLEDTTAKVSIPSGKNIELNLNGKTIDISGNYSAIENSGTLNVYNGTLISSATSNAVINNNAGAVLYLNDIDVLGQGERSALYNKANGIVYIDANSYLKTEAPDRGSIVNLADGTIYVYGGKIEATQQEGINNAGNLIIGTEDGTANSELPIIIGTTYGINSTTDYSFYDGIIKGIDDAVNDIHKITSQEENYELINSTETIVDTVYKTLYLSVAEGKYLVHLNAKGGSVTPTSILVNQGEAIGELPTPSKGIYTFDGWYTSESYTTRVSSTTKPLGNTTYFAKWVYNANENVVEYDDTPNAIHTYYSSIEGSTTNSEDYVAAMVDNFNNYSCQCTDNTCSTAGDVLCDKPSGYDTGTNAKVDVYFYDTNTNTRGDKVSYAKSDNGIIYNLVPYKTYYWELSDDSNVHGYVKFTNKRRLLDIGEARNIRDIGGTTATYTDLDGNTVNGIVNYEKLYRGTKLGNNATTKTELIDLGITEEVDLRANSEITSSNDVQLDNFKAREIKHYQIDSANYPNYYNMTRAVVREIMQDVVDGKVVYFHCRIGADRTGTMAYILEGLLGVSESNRLEDYELSFFYGLVNRTRYFAEDPTSSVSTNEKFVYMHNFLNTNESIYDWYMEGTTDEDADKQLIDNFRKKMIRES